MDLGCLSFRPACCVLAECKFVILEERKKTLAKEVEAEICLKLRKLMGRSQKLLMVLFLPCASRPFEIYEVIYTCVCQCVCAAHTRCFCSCI